MNININIKYCLHKVNDLLFKSPVKDDCDGIRGSGLWTPIHYSLWPIFILVLGFEQKLYCFIIVYIVLAGNNSVRGHGSNKLNCSKQEMWKK